MDSPSYPAKEVSLDASFQVIFQYNDSFTHAVSTVESNRAKCDIAALSILFHRLGTRNSDTLGRCACSSPSSAVDDRSTELCFWLFLVNSSLVHQDWFRSLYFKIWAVGSCIAVVAIPLITILTREDVYKCEAYTFLAGGLASLSLTICFLPVLWNFPSFIANLKQQGVESNTLVRLTTYHELNCIRIVFRFLFTISFVILGIDGVRPHQHINDKMFPTDILGIIAGVGCVISSGLTLVIFFPRSVEGEMMRKEQRRARRKHRASRWNNEDPSYIHFPPSKLDLNRLDGTPFGTQPNASYEAVAPGPRGQDCLRSKKALLEDMDPLGGSVVLQPNRLNLTGDVELGGVLTVGDVELIRARSKRVSSLVHHWRSPIGACVALSNGVAMVLMQTVFRRVEIGRPTMSR
ncbi:hypothetical protein J3R82DRAFT_3218 [Butyriboletus roseoflavus]|nr:hypothetical protein J3R82DRAFT_3218 [Butyriboletus roseoflavus]